MATRTRDLDLMAGVAVAMAATEPAGDDLGAATAAELVLAPLIAVDPGGEAQDDDEQPVDGYPLDQEDMPPPFVMNAPTVPRPHSGRHWRGSSRLPVPPGVQVACMVA
jgi:hypothetical protein